MKEQDESYLDSLLDAFAREAPLEQAPESGGRHRKREKSQAEARRETIEKRRKQEDNPDQNPDDALVFEPFESMEEPGRTPEFAGSPDEMEGDASEPDFGLEDFKDLEWEDTELDEELPDFSLDDLDLKEWNPASVSNRSGTAEGEAGGGKAASPSGTEDKGDTGASLKDQSEQTEAAVSKAAAADPVRSGGAEEEDIARILNQIEEANEPGDLAGIAEEPSPKESVLFESEPSGETGEIGLTDGLFGINTADENTQAGEDKMADHDGTGGETGLSDEIGVTDEIGLSDEIGAADGIGLPDEIGVTDEIGMPDVDLFDLLGSPGQEPYSGGNAAVDGPLPPEGAGQAEEKIEEKKTGRKKSRKKKEKDAQGVQEPEETGTGFSMKAMFRKLFGNIPVEGEAEAGLLPKDAETEEERKEAKKAEKAKAKEEKKAAKEEAKKAKQAAAKAKAEDKKEEKENRKKEEELKEMKEVAPETETGRINRIGAVIVFSFFVIIAAVILIGSNASFYELSVQGAEKEFAMRHYNEAYYKIRGIEVKPADMELHDRIMTVMYVNKQLNSYNNFYSMEDYPKALDSLVKGLERYEKYLALAQELGIEGDLDYVRNQILAELDRVYGLEERDAMNLTKMEDTTDYSSRIYDAASKVQKEEKDEEEEYVP